MPPNSPNSVSTCTERIPRNTETNTKRSVNAWEDSNSKVVEPVAKTKDETIGQDESHETGSWLAFKTPLIWPNIIGITILHIGTLYAIFTYPGLQYKTLTLWGKFYFYYETL